MAFISSKGVYGLAAMQMLSKMKDNNPLQIKDITKEQEIPQNYLEQILAKLKKAGFVKSIRGSRGGYLLAKFADEIVLIDIIEVLEGDIKVVDTVVKNPVTNLFFEEIQEKMEMLLECTLSGLEKYQKKYNENLHYII